MIELDIVVRKQTTGEKAMELWREPLLHFYIRLFRHVSRFLMNCLLNDLVLIH